MQILNIALIGAGQLGSRHLQGLKKAQVQMNIYVVDACEESLKISELRYNEVEDNPLIQQIVFTTKMEELPQHIDLAVIATSSKPRAAIIRSLVEQHQCKQFILEKVLFPKLSEYDEISQLFIDNGVRAWVNCARRYFDFYQKLRAILINDGPIDFKIEGKNWGLCCNSIHMIDLFAYLSGETQIQFDCGEIDPKIYESKRSGYIEMTGTIRGTTSQGSRLQISSYEEYEGELHITLQSQSHQAEIFEGRKTMMIDGEQETLLIPFQSEMTGKYVEELTRTQQLPLATFEESVLLHKQILPHFIHIYNKIKGVQSDLCPIT